MCLDSGKPSLMALVRSNMLSPEGVATCTCSHVTILVECRADVYDSCRSDSWSGRGVYSEEMPAISWISTVIGDFVNQSEMP